MKKIMLLIFAAYISLFAIDKENLLGDNSKSTREFKEYSFSQFEEQEAINNKEAEINLEFKKVLNKQNEIIASYKEIVESYKYKIKNLESDIDSQQSKINKLDSRIYTLENKLKYK